MLQPHRSERDLTPLFLTLRRNAWLILLVATVASVGAYLVAKRQTTRYSASAALLFKNSNLDQELFGNSILGSVQDPTRQAATNLSLVQLPTVAERVGKKLHVSLSRVQADVAVGSDAESDVLQVTATDHSPSLAAALANAYVTQYIAFRRTADQNQLAQAERLVASRLLALPARQRQSANAQDLRNRQFELQQLAALQTGNAEIVETAVPPRMPSSPTPGRDAVIGGVLGLLLSIALVVVLDRRDRRLKTSSDVEQLFQLPVLGTVPEAASLRSSGLALSPRDQEPFRMLRAQLRYFDVDRDVRSVMITSADSGEGKSIVSLNLTRAAARSDNKRVLLIEADLRKPTLGRIIGAEGMAGLAELLSQSRDLEEGLRELVVTPQPETDPLDRLDSSPAAFDVLLAGSAAPNPIELLESQRMADLLNLAVQRYDSVFIDTPPIAVVSDAISLVHRVDGVIAVARLNRTRRDHAAALMTQLRSLNASVLGVVINGVPSGKAQAYGYDYYTRPAGSDAPREAMGLGAGLATGGHQASE